jgi:pimeloyl-ACP methyl ester carboxylesterase
MNKIKKFFIIIFVASLILQFNFPALANSPKPDYFIDESKLPFDPLPGIDSERFWGIHNGAGYRIEVPADWNGDLVVWAHGYRGDVLELTVDNPPLRDWLIENGYAWAASSYSKNAYNVAQAAKDTHALTTFFNGLVGKPDYTFISGVSMGGHIAAVLIEQWPNSYDGAMPMCGVMADYEMGDFFLDFNLVSQALAGIEAVYPPADDFLLLTVPKIKNELEMIDETFPFTLNTQGEQFKAVVKLRSGGERPIFNQAFLFWNGIVPDDFMFWAGTINDTLTKVKGMPVDNYDTVYQFDTDPTLSAEEQELNDTILRVMRDPQSNHPDGLANMPVVGGDITIPVLTLHDLGDLFVPFSMEQIYAQRVADKGASHLLVQRAIRSFEHCGFTMDEITQGFEDLVSWVKDGISPPGDDLLDPDVVADPNFGCNFTSEDRVWPFPLTIPACPE